MGTIGIFTLLLKTKKKVSFLERVTYLKGLEFFVEVSVWAVRFVDCKNLRLGKQKTILV